jgi:electron transfer flavoprotein beta subunit
MKIIICVKQICYVYARTGMDPEQNFLAPEDKIYRVNPYDEVAVELALKVKELHGAGEVIILTLGTIIAEAELRRCLAMGADHLYWIDRGDKMDPWHKSGFLAQAVKDIGADLVLCGKESLDTQSGQVGAFMAHHLEVPFVSAITELAIDENSLSAQVRRSAGRGLREVIECPLPAVFSVDLGLHELRLPTYKNKKKALSVPIQKLSYREEIIAPKTISMGIFTPRPRPKWIPPPDSRLAAYARIEQLLTGSRIEKKGMILSGDPESQADGIISFLREHGFLEGTRG